MGCRNKHGDNAPGSMVIKSMSADKQRLTIGMNARAVGDLKLFAARPGLLVILTSKLTIVRASPAYYWSHVCSLQGRSCRMEIFPAPSVAAC